MSIRIEEKTALAMMAVIGAGYEQGTNTWSAPDLAMHFSLPVAFVERIVLKMDHAGFIVRLYWNSGAYIPAHPLDSVTVADFYERYRSAGEGRYLSAERIHAPDAVGRAIRNIGQANAGSLSGLTLRDISMRDHGGIAVDNAGAGHEAPRNGNDDNSTGHAPRE